jgi:hypothetical protein
VVRERQQRRKEVVDANRRAHDRRTARAHTPRRR